MDNPTGLPQNVLIIEPKHTVLTQLTDIIHNVGCIARPVSSARHAVDAIEAMLPSLIIMDISIPDIDGFLFFSMLRKNFATSEIPVIFVSANNSPDEKVMCYKAGAVGYIPIPFEAEEVAFRVKFFLNFFKEKKELEENHIRLYSVINDQIKKVEEAQKHVVYALVKLVAKRNPGKAQYYEFIAKNSRLLAISLQLSSIYKDKITTDFIDAIELTAPLFDISSICHEDINPPLAGTEFLEELLSKDKQNGFLRMAIDITRYQHENWDGSGLSEGISGTEIPLCARIIAIIITFNTFISNSDYGKAYSCEATMEYINSKSGIYFDPDIVYILNKIKNQLKY